MELRRLLVILRRRLVLLVVIVVAGAAAAYLGSSRASVYQAQATVYVGEASTNLNPTTQLGQAFLADTLAGLIPTPTVVQGAIDSTKAPRKAAAVVKATKATVNPGTNLIHITVQDRDPAVARSLANGIAQTFVAGTSTLVPLSNAAGAATKKAPASIAQTATLPVAPLATGLHRNVALGALAALLIGIVVILLIDFVGLSARTPKQLETQLDLAVIGVVPLQPQIEQAGPAQQGNILLVGDDA